MPNNFAKILQYPKSILLLCLITFFVLSSGIVFLSFHTNYRMFFSAENPYLQAFETLQNTYTKNDNLLFVISPKSGKVFSSDVLSVVQEFTEQAWQIPYAIRVDSITNFQHTYAKGDELIVEDLVEDPNLTKTVLQAKEQIALQEPTLVQRLISKNGKHTGINVIVQLPGENEAVEIPLVAKHANTLKKEFASRFPDIDFRVTGVVMQNYAFTESSIHDATTLIPIMFFLIIFGAGLFLKSFIASFVVMLMMLFSIFPALGFGGWIGIKLNVATIVSPIMIMTLAVADAIHLLSNFFLKYDHLCSKMQAMIYSIKVNFRAVFLTSLTTVVGFLTLNFSEVPPFHDLGNIVAAGITLAFFFSLTLLPALIMLLPVKPRTISQKRKPLLVPLSAWVIKNAKAIFVAFAGCSLIALMFVPRNQLNDEWISYFSPKLAFREQADFTLNHLTGLGSLHFSLKAKGPDEISDPEYLKKVDDFANWLRKQPEVVHVNTITDTFKRLNKNLHGDNMHYYKLPETQELAAQYLLLYELSLPFGLDLNNQINIDKSATRLQISTKKLSTNALLAFQEKIAAYQKSSFPSYMQSAGSSPDVMFAHIGFSNIRSMLFGTIVSLIIISFLLIIAFRSFRYGFISLLPNLLPAGLAFGIWGLWVGEVGLSLSIVTGMSLGIIVDDTIHFMSKYTQARKTSTSEEAIRYAFDHVGDAILITTMLFVIGFGILTFSSFKLNSSMGLLTAITLFIALLTDLFFLPACLLLLEKDAGKLSRLNTNKLLLRIKIKKFLPWISSQKSKDEHKKNPE